MYVSLAVCLKQFEADWVDVSVKIPAYLLCAYANVHTVRHTHTHARTHFIYFLAHVNIYALYDWDYWIFNFGPPQFVSVIVP